MNCEQVDAALDATGEPDAAAREAVQRHLASCSECREAWAAYRELTTERIPSTPRNLAALIDAALAGGASTRASRARLSLAIGALLVVGAAAAGAIAWRIGFDAPSAAAPRVETQLPAEAASPRVEPLSSPAPDSRGSTNDAAPSAASAEAPDPRRFALDIHSVVVVFRPDPEARPDFAAELGRCRDDFVRELRAVGFNVIADERVTGLAGSGLTDWEIAQEVGAGTAVGLSSARLSPVLPNASCMVDARSGDVRLPKQFVFSNPNLPPDRRWEAFAKRIAEQLRDSLRDPSTLALEVQATVLDTSLADGARLDALYKLSPVTPTGVTPLPEAFDTAIVAAALEIATKSRDAAARARAWLWIRSLKVRDSQLVPSLLVALTGDSTEVRRLAAQMLGDFVRVPGVAEALASAVAGDPQDRPEHACCVLTVRETARRALLSDEEPHAAIRKILLDESVPPHDRLMLTAPSGEIYNLRGLGDDAARAVFEIGAHSADADIRWTAWQLLTDVRDPAFVPTLLDDVARHPNDLVRRWAASALTWYRDDPDVSAALGRAQGDPVDSVQKAARDALAGNRGFSLGRP